MTCVCCLLSYHCVSPSRKVCFSFHWTPIRQMKTAVSSPVSLSPLVKIKQTDFCQASRVLQLSNYLGEPPWYLLQYVSVCLVLRSKLDSYPNVVLKMAFLWPLLAALQPSAIPCSPAPTQQHPPLQVLSWIKVSGVPRAVDLASLTGLTGCACAWLYSLQQFPDCHTQFLSSFSPCFTNYWTNATSVSCFSLWCSFVSSLEF